MQEQASPQHHLHPAKDPAMRLRRLHKLVDARLPVLLAGCFFSQVP